MILTLDTGSHDDWEKEINEVIQINVLIILVIDIFDPSLD